jgi:hypothetical protein
MIANSIGIQVIMPKTGTSPQTAPPPPANDNDSDSRTAAPKQAPPPPGMGKFVDKTA